MHTRVTSTYVVQERWCIVDEWDDVYGYDKLIDAEGRLMELARIAKKEHAEHGTQYELRIIFRVEMVVPHA